MKPYLAIIGFLVFAACDSAHTPSETSHSALTQTPDSWVDSLFAAHTGRAKLTIVFVLDGLRPDAIDPVLTPNLHALRASGVSFSASHSVFPTVTRVNASALVTGRYPAANGILGNV